MAPRLWPGLAADRRGRMQHAGDFDCRVRLGELGDHRRRQVLDVRDLDDLRLRRRLDPDRMRAQGADDPLGDDPLLAAVLVAAQQLLAEVVVDGGVGAAPGRAGEGDGGDAGAGAAHQQLRAGADEGRLGACRSRSRSRRGTARAWRRTGRPGRGRSRRRRRPRGRARPCSSPRFDPRSPPHRGFEVARWAGAADLRGAVGCGSSSGSAASVRRPASRAPRRRRGLDVLPRARPPR